jgi:hypothetical protein
MKRWPVYLFILNASANLIIHKSQSGGITKLTIEKKEKKKGFTSPILNFTYSDDHCLVDAISL